MGDSWFGGNSPARDNYEQWNDAPREHKAKLSHEVLGGAAAFEAAKAYEDHVAREGHPDSHAKAKEIFAGIAGAIVDREVETHGLDFFDREKAKYHAREQGEEALERRHGDRW